MEHRVILPTRGCSTASYFVISPDNWVDNALPFFDDIVVRPMATPRLTQTRFAQYLMDFGPTGKTSRPVGDGYEHFLYQLAGEVRVTTSEHAETLAAQSFCFLPCGLEFSLEAVGGSPARMLLTKRVYEAVEGLAPPAPIYGTQSETADITPPSPGRYLYKELMPTAEHSHDMAMNVLTCEPGGSIGLVEVHHQEHGLFMLTGQGIYYLAGDCIEVRANDYIYMAPYCPQSFWATGSELASYLLYKDVNRDGF